MVTLGIFAILILVVGMFYIIYLIDKDPHNTVVKFIFSWQYRMLRKIKDMYIWGQQKTPPDSYSFFLSQAEAMLNESLSSKPLVESMSTRFSQAKEIVEMLQKESYVKHYFTQDTSFSGMTYHRMRQDYRTGDYLKKDYSIEERLMKILPAPIVANEKAFRDYMKLVYAGWFNEETGMYVLAEGRKKKHIGRAIKIICNRSRIPVPGRVFSELFNAREETIKEWTRDDEDSNRIDDEIKFILNH